MDLLAADLRRPDYEPGRCGGVAYDEKVGVVEGCDEGKVIQKWKKTVEGKYAPHPSMGCGASTERRVYIVLPYLGRAL